MNSGTKHRVRRYSLAGHPLAMNSFCHWIRLLRWGGRVDPKYYGRALFVTLLSPLSAIGRAHEYIAYHRAIDAVEIKKDPIFIIGHWRSGTTHLHNLLCHDPQFGYVTTFQSQAPKTFLAGKGIIRPIMAALMPRMRPMDNMELGTELPQEEEFCICHATMLSAYITNFFSRRDATEVFNKFILWDGVTDAEFEAWKREYIEIVKKATLNMGGRQLVLKNPCNTARVEAVLRVFPNAKFINIYRNPYDVYKSTLHLLKTFQELMTFQPIDAEARKERVLTEYKAVMQRYFEVRERIPKNRLAEIRYETLEQHPLEELERIYRELDIPNWQTARLPIAQYLATLRTYQKNTYPLTPEDVHTVNAHFAFKELGYPIKSA